MYTRALFLLTILLIPVLGEAKSPKKLYVPHEAVTLSNQTIFIELKENHTKYFAKALYQDKKGLYVYLKDLSPLQAKKIRWWRCWSCGLWNWQTFTFCETCNAFRKRASDQDIEMMEDAREGETLQDVVKREIQEWNDRCRGVREKLKQMQDDRLREIAARRERRRKEDEAAGELSPSEKFKRFLVEWRKKRAELKAKQEKEKREQEKKEREQKEKEKEQGQEGQ